METYTLIIIIQTEIVGDINLLVLGLGMVLFLIYVDSGWDWSSSSRGFPSTACCELGTQAHYCLEQNMTKYDKLADLRKPVYALSLCTLCSKFPEL
jgi:hypothetical protein